MEKYSRFLNASKAYAKLLNSSKYEYKRECFDFFWNKLQNHNLVFVGLRQIGKTTIAIQLIKKFLEKHSSNKLKDKNELVKKEDNYLYLNIKSFGYFDITELLTFITNASYDIVFLDEIQTIENWTNFSQALIDANPNTRFILSGSNATSLTKEIMFNRAKIFNMNPLNFNEYKSIWKDNSIINYFKFGSFPKISGYESADIQYWEIIEELIIDKIMTENFTISKATKFKLIMKKLTNFVGNELKISKLVENIDNITRQTARQYLNIMEKSALVKLVYKYEDLSSKPIAKVYFTDKSMIYKFNDFNELDNNAMGAFAENMVFNYLDTEYNKLYFDSKIWSYRNEKNKEIDFIIPSKKMLIEVKHIEANQDTWNEIVKEYESRIKTKQKDFLKILITKNTKRIINGWKLIPLRELLEGGLDVLRKNT